MAKNKSQNPNRSRKAAADSEFASESTTASSAMNMQTPKAGQNSSK